jgi:hypothetical protein
MRRKKQARGVVEPGLQYGIPASHRFPLKSRVSLPACSTGSDPAFPVADAKSATWTRVCHGKPGHAYIVSRRRFLNVFRLARVGGHGSGREIREWQKLRLWEIDNGR